MINVHPVRIVLKRAVLAYWTGLMICQLLRIQVVAQGVLNVRKAVQFKL